MIESEISTEFSNSENCYYGHGTGTNNLEIIQSIFRNGLRCSHEQLYFTTVALGLGSDTLFTESKETMDNWAHKDSKQIVIVSIPIKFQLLDIVGTPLYGKKEAAFYDNISTEEAKKIGIAQGYYLKPEFVQGVYDATTQKFLKNEKYYENLPEEEQIKLFKKIKIQYMDILKKSGYSFSEYSEILRTCNRENPLTTEEIIEGDSQVFDAKMIERQLSENAKQARTSEVETVTNVIKDDAQRENDENSLEGWLVDDEW